MANDLNSNITRPLAREFLKAFEANRVLTKAVDTQIIKGKHSARTGSTVDVKRPTDYNTIETADGDISSSNKSDILTGKASATVQNYITVATEWDNVEEALELDQLDQLLKPMATRAVTQLELNLGQFMLNNCGGAYGTPGTAIDAWSDVAGCQAHMESLGIPTDSPWSYVMNPHTSTALADAQNGLYAADGLVKTAWEKAQLPQTFGGMGVMKSNALKTRTASALGGDRVGAVTSSVPDATYVTHKDTMIQSIAVDGFTGNVTIKAGEIVEVTGPNRLSLSTREQIVDASGAAVKWRGTVTADVTLSSGAGTISVAGPAIYEANGQYNTVDAAIAENDVVTILGSDSAVYQPALAFHKQAFCMATISLPKLYATDTVARTEDGCTFRVTKYSDGDSNVQKVRFDILPAFGCLNPYFSMQAYGS